MPIIPNDTVSSILNLVNRANSDSVVQPPLPRASFALDASGVAGFFGGDTAVRAMATVYLIRQRRWLGWYNAPGAYEVAKQYSGIVTSLIFDALFPGGDGDPGKIFTVVDRQVDRGYTPLYTGRALSSIGPLGLLFMRKLFQMPITKENRAENQAEKMDTMGPLRVRFVRILQQSSNELYRQDVDGALILAVLTILINVGGCIAGALVGDWFCFASISIGIVANGMACLVIGSGELYLKYDRPTQNEGDTPGDVLLRADTDIIALLGKEGVIRPLTHGRFALKFGDTPWSSPKPAQSNHDVDGTVQSGDPKGRTPMDYLIHISVFLLLLQFLAQLLLIPQSTLFGQLMFIGTLVSSWMYHLYLSTLRLDLQTEALFRKLSINEREDIYQHPFNTRVEAVVFACLAFSSIHLYKLKPEVAEYTVKGTAPPTAPGTAPATGTAPPTAQGIAPATVPATAQGTAPPTAQATALPTAQATAQATVPPTVPPTAQGTAPPTAQGTATDTKVDEVDKAVKTLLFSLLPEENNVLRVFKETLVERMSLSAIINYVESEDPSFHFTESDAKVKVPNGELRVRRKDIGELRQYQEEAEEALQKWKSDFWNKQEMFQLTDLYK